MTELAERIVGQTIDHVVAVLREDLAADLRTITTIAEVLPGFASQLPFVSVDAASTAQGALGLGRTMALKTQLVDSARVDLGTITADAGECAFTLCLWAATLPQLRALREAIFAVGWVQRERSWVDPLGILNRTIFRRCRLDKVSAGAPVPLPPPPPRIAVAVDALDLHETPSAASRVLGQARRGDEFALLGRDSLSAWVQGCCFAGQPAWMAVQSVEVSLPMLAVPITDGGGRAVRASTRGRRRAALDQPAAAASPSIDPGTAILATSTKAVTTVWRQELQFRAYLEASQEPTTSSGPPIEQIDIIRHLAEDGRILDTEHTRRLAKREEIVDQ